MKLLAVAGLLLAFAGCASRATLAKEEPKVDDWAKSRDCAHQANEVFKSGGWDKDTQTYATFRNHYSASLNRCFVMIMNSASSRDGLYVGRYVQDAFERKEVAELRLTRKFGGGTSAPDACYVTSTASGEKKSCTTESEFETLVKAYME